MIFSESEQKRLVADYTQAWVSEAQKVEALTASINLDGIRDYEDSDAEESRLHAEYKLITDIRDAKKAAVAAGVDEYGNELHEVVKTPGYQRASDAAAAFRDAVDKLRDLGKIRTQESGKAELAAMPADAPIEDRAAAIFRKHGYRPAPARLRETIDHIRNRTALGYLRDVVGNTDNKATREIFSVISGIKLPATRRDSLVVLDEWFGVSLAQRAQMDAEKEAARLQKLALDDLLYAWSALKHLNVRLDGGRVVDGQVYVQEKFVEGFTEATRHKQGASYQYCLNAGSRSNYVKNSKLNAFLKQAIEFGGLRAALEKVWPDIPTEKDVETEEGSDPDIDALFGAAEFAPTSPEGYAKVMADPGLQIKHQDALDDFFGERVVAVRNALRDCGWTGEHSAPVLLKTDGEMAYYQLFDYTQVGSGRNVVGVAARVQSTEGYGEAVRVKKNLLTLVDDLSDSPEQLAAKIDAAAQRDASRDVTAEDGDYYYVHGELGMQRNGSFTKEKQDWMVFTRDEALPMMRNNIMPYGATKRGVFVGAGSGERLKLPAGPVTPQVPAGDMEKYIKVAADSIGALRKVDVYRVLVESNRTEFRRAIADYIKGKRPDLHDEVDSVMAEAEHPATQDGGEKHEGEERKRAKPSMRG